MVPKFVFTFLLVFVTYGSILCQEPSLLADVEGSGDGITDFTAPSGPEAPPELEEVESKAAAVTSSGTLTPVCELCSCIEEGVGDEYTMTVDCSHKDLTEVPEGINDTTTKLNLQFNKLEKVPKSLSSLKNLKVLNVNNNSIKELEFGSISYLSELTELNLENNRLLEVPQELKNSFGLTKLKELNLNGNDIRELSVDNFSQFKQLQILKVLEIKDSLMQNLCSKLKPTLLEVCRKDECLNCEDALEDVPDEFMPVHPGMIAADVLIHQEEVAEAAAAANNTSTTTTADGNITTSTLSTPVLTNVTSPKPENTTEFSLRAAVDKEFHSRRVSNTTEGEGESGKQKEDMKVEVHETETIAEKSGGVSTLLIGLVVAGMVVVIAFVVIRKNWSSVRNTFSSSPRPNTDRTANGNAPEEVPLREKANPV